MSGKFFRDKRDVCPRGHYHSLVKQDRVGFSHYGTMPVATSRYVRTPFASLSVSSLSFIATRSHARTLYQRSTSVMTCGWNSTFYSFSTAECFIQIG